MPLAFDDDAIDAASKALCEVFRARRWRLATAESCTGGGIAHAVTGVPGSSDVLDRGFVAYSNDAKIDMLGVDAASIGRHGAVSEAVALAMADGALRASGADASVAVTGIAGPGGGTPAKPVGTVCFGWATLDGKRIATTHRLDGDRAAVRAQSVAIALAGLIDLAAPEAAPDATPTVAETPVPAPAEGGDLGRSI